MRSRLILGLALAAVLPGAAAAEGPTHADPAARELVVVLHGMGRTPRSMRPVEDALRNAGYDVLNIGYSSYCCSIAELGQAVQGEVAAKRGPQHDRVHFVGHSLGGIIARWIVTQPDAPRGVVRMVMLAARDDGKVRVDETHLSGQRAHIVVMANHTFIMREPEVHRLTLEFLRTGTFTP